MPSSILSSNSPAPLLPSCLMCSMSAACMVRQWRMQGITYTSHPHGSTRIDAVTDRPRARSLQSGHGSRLSHAPSVLRMRVYRRTAVATYQNRQERVIQSLSSCAVRVRACVRGATRHYPFTFRPARNVIVTLMWMVYLLFVFPIRKPITLSMHSRLKMITIAMFVFNIERLEEVMRLTACDK